MANVKCVKGVYALPEGRKRVMFTDGTTTSYARVIAAIKLGRPLRHDEVVHHRNRNQADDAFHNLEVFTSQSDHAAHHGHERKARRTDLPHAVKINLRIEPQLKIDLAAVASENGRSLNAEITRRLRASLVERWR